MIKCLSLLLLVAASQAFVVRERREAEDLPAPSLIRMTLVDNPVLGFKLDWTPVTAPQGSDPVLGYKVKVWEDQKIKRYRYEIVDGVKKLVEEEFYAGFDDKVPSYKPREVVVQGADSSTAQVSGIETGVTYETRVQAYSKKGDGPLSEPMRIKVSPGNDSDRDVYTVE